MSVGTFRGTADDLKPLVLASRAEGWDFVVKLAAEIRQGEFRQPDTALFGFYGGALLGVCGLVRDPYPPHRPEVGRLRHLDVPPEHRGQGVATALVTAAVQAARPHCRVLRLRTENPGAARLYERLGFAPVTEPAATHVLAL